MSWSFTPDRADIRITTYQSVPYALHTATAANPSGGDVTYSLLSTFPANFTDSINFTPSDRVVSLTAELTTPVSASIYIRATTATEQATLVLRLAAVDPPPLAATLVNASAVLLVGETGVVASLSVSGGGGTYTYSVGGDFAVSADGLLSLATAQSNVATLTATVVVNDTHDNTSPGKRFLDPDDSRAGFIYSGRCHPELDNPRRRRAGDTAPGRIYWAVWDAKLCLGIHESE